MNFDDWWLKYVNDRREWNSHLSTLHPNARRRYGAFAATCTEDELARMEVAARDAWNAVYDTAFSDAIESIAANGIDMYIGRR